jgi:hypothetical protein
MWNPDLTIYPQKIFDLFGIYSISPFLKEMIIILFLSIIFFLFLLYLETALIYKKIIVERKEWVKILNTFVNPHLTFLKNLILILLIINFFVSIFTFITYYEDRCPAKIKNYLSFIKKKEG